MQPLIDLLNEDDEEPLRLFVEVVVERMAALRPGDRFDVRDVVASFIAGQPPGAVPLDLADSLHAIASTVYDVAERSVSQSL